MSPQITVYSLIGLLLLLSASFLSADGVESNSSGQESVIKDSNIQQSVAEVRACEKPANENADSNKGAKLSPSEQAQLNDMQSEFENFREGTWDDRYRY